MKSVVIWAQSNFNWLWVGFAGKIKRETGAKIHFTGFYPNGTKFWESQDKNGVIDSITDANFFAAEYDIWGDPPEKVYGKARYYEEKYGMFFVDVLQSDRHLGRGFYAGGAGHPRSEFSKKAEYLKSVNMFNKACRFWEDYFDRIKPDLIIGFASGIVGKTFIAIARAKNIPVRTLTHSRYQSYYYWAADEYDSWPEAIALFSKIKDVNNIKDEELDSIRRHPRGESGYKRWNKYRSISFVIGESFYQIRKYLGRKFGNVAKIGNYGLIGNLKYVYAMHSAFKSINKYTTVKLEDLNDMPYVLYSLQEEPETALSLLSPEFNEQLAAIELLAKNLPVGVRLIVKEHIFAVGRRPVDFYSTINDIPNVKMYSVFGYASDVARGAKAVAVITSSVGLETALLGIPVISFGLHNNFNIIPHVYTVQSWTELRPLLAKLCSDETDEEKRKRRLDGKRFLSAIKQAGIDMSFSNYKSKDRGPATEKEIEVLYSALIKSVK